MAKVMTSKTSSVYAVPFPTRSALKSFNFYVLEQAGKLSLIDAGINTEKCYNFLNQVLNENGYSIYDISQVLVTHNHEDHIGLVNRITSKVDIPVYAPLKSIHRLKRDKDFFSMRINFFKNLYQKMGCGALGEKQVEKLEAAARYHENNKVHANLLPLKEKDMIGDLEVIETPGHSPDHIIFLDRERDWLFCGDFLINHISSNALVEPNQEGQRLKTLVQQEQSLLHCARLNVEVGYPGHGEYIFHFQELVQKRLDGIKHKANRILKLVEQGIQTADQIAQSFYQVKYESEFSLVMSEIIGHLDYLENDQKVQKELKEGVWHYSTF